MRVVFAIILSLLTSTAYAQAPFARITSPQDGDVLYGPTIEVSYTTDNEENRGMLDVQYVYLKQDQETCLYSQEFTGTAEFTQVSAGQRRFFIRMENTGFIPVGDTHEVTVTVLPRRDAPSPSISSPAADSVVKRSDVVVKYNVSGGQLPSNFSHVAYKLDSGSEVVEDGDGQFTLSGLTDGAQSLIIRLVDLNGSTIGSPVAAAFTVRTALSPKNARKAKKQLAKLHKRKLNAAGIKKLNKLLKLMRQAGAQNPNFPEINNTDVRKAIKILKKGKKKPSKKQLKAIKKLFV